MTKDPPKLLALGKIAKPHGLQGFFYCRAPNSLKKGDTLFLGKTLEKTEKIVLTGLKNHQGKTLLSLSIAKDRTALEKYLGFYLWGQTPQEDSSQTNEFTQHLNKEVYDSEKALLGLCTDFYDYGASPVIVIQNKEGMTLELPFNETYFTNKVTLVAKFQKTFFDELWQKL